MKKLFAKITVIVLALLLVFSFGACTDNGKDKDKDKDNPTGTTVNEVIDNAVTAMLAKNGFTVDADVDLTMPWVSAMTEGMTSRMTVAADLAVAKTTGDYDVSGEITMTNKDVDPDFMEENEITEEMLTNVTTITKKGNVVFSAGQEEGVWNTSYTEAVDLGNMAAQIKTALAGVELGEAKKEANGEYKFTASVDYGEYIKAFKKLVIENKKENFGTVAADLIGGEDYTKAMLVSDVKAVFADDITVSGMITALNAFFGHTGMNMTVKQIADTVTPVSGMTAQTLYNLMTQNGGGGQIKAPGENDTVYDFLVANFGDMKVDTLLAMKNGGSADGDADTMQAGNAMTVAGLRATILSYVESDTLTFGAFYDEMIPMLEQMVQYNELAQMVLPYVFDMQAMETIGADGDNGGFVLVTSALEKYTVGENKFEAEVVLNSDHTLKSIKITFKNHITYTSAEANAKPVDLCKSDVTATVTFGYTNVPAITEPDGTLIKPCVKEYWTVDELPASGDWVIDVYVGKGYTLEVGDSSGNPPTGITYAAGKITVSAATVETIRSRINENRDYNFILNYKAGTDGYSGISIWVSAE